MADACEKRASDPPPDNNDDKQKGICKIKSEYIVSDHVRQLSQQCLSEVDKSKIVTEAEEEISEEPSPKRKKYKDNSSKLRGQNKSRPPPFKAARDQNLCPWIVDQAKEEPEKKCQNLRCTFMHDRAAYLKIKAKDIGEDCYMFKLSGRCPRGVACRVGGKHLTDDGYNIVDVEKFAGFQKKPPATKNQITKGLQDKLRKRKYNFSKAEKIIKMNEALKKKANSEKNKTNGQVENEKKQEDNEVNNENFSNSLPPSPSNGEIPQDSLTLKTEEKENKCRIGAVPDDDLIRLRTSEKKKIDWRDKIVLSPLTTVGNLPFRRICKEYGADVTCGEMALAPKILKGTPEEWALVKRHESEDIFGVQVCGNNTGVLARCAQLLNEEADVDYIDLNLGCPIDLIYRQGGGSGMLNRLGVLESTIKSVNELIDIPLTIKTRMGVYMDKPIAHNLMPKFRNWGASMVTVHGRSREQRYTKSADWDYIERCAQAADPLPVFGNGDILSYDDYARVRDTYKTIQGVTIGRGALIKPWIFKEIKDKTLLDVRSSERFSILKKYADYGLDHWGSDTRGVETTRRFMLEWISFLHRYIPVGILESPPQRINERPPYYSGRDEMETLMASSNCADWIKISEMLLGKVPESFHFLPKHKANSWK